MPDASTGGIAADPILTLEGLTKQYGTSTTVGPIDLDVRKGEFLTLLGPSGCGKTTTLHIIAGLLRATGGRVRLAGRDITGLEPSKRDMGVVFQNYALFPHKTIFDNVAFGLRMRKVARPEIEERVLRMLDTVGMKGVEHRLPGQISGGQRQRVALARALVIEPTVLLLDEPLSNLDALLRKRMRYEIRDLQQRVGITTIFVTHDQDEAFEMSDRVALLDKGRLQQVGTPEELYGAPATRFVAEFIGDANLVPGKVVAREEGDRVRVRIADGTELAAHAAPGKLQPGDSADLVLRPERIDLATSEPQGSASIAARIVKRTFSGEHVNFELEAGHGIRLACRKPSLPQFMQLGVGEPVWVQPGEGRALEAQHD